MQLIVNETVYDVNIAPLRERAGAAMEGIIADDKNPVLRQMVKGACAFAMTQMGLEKQHRNDDPIRIVAHHIAGIIFDSMERSGLHVEGEVVGDMASLPESEEVADHAD